MPKETPLGKSAGSGSSSGKGPHRKPGARPTRFAPMPGGGGGRGAVVVNAPSNYYGAHTTRGAVEVTAAPAHRAAVRVREAPTAEERRLFEPMYAWDYADRYGPGWTRPWRRSHGGGRRSDDGRRLVLRSTSGLGQTTLDTATTVGWVAVTLLAAGVYFVVTSDVRPNRRRRRH